MASVEATAPAAVIPKELFDSETTDFQELLDSNVESVRPGFQLTLQTLAGSQFVLRDLDEKTTLEEVKQQAADLVGAPAHSIKLLSDDEMLSCGGQCLAEAGVLSSTSLLTLVRCPATRAEVTRLFGQLQSAIKHRNGDEARRLVDQGAGFDGEGNVLKAGAHMYFPGDNTVVDKEPGNTMLHLAIREGLSGLALHLISRNVDLNSCSDIQRTPLMMAILKKQSRVIEALLHAGVSISTCDYLGNTALAYALKANDDELAAKLALLAIGVGHTGTDQFGRTALHYAHNLSQAVYAGSRIALIEMLLQKGANVDARDACGNLPAAGVQDPPPENQESSESYLMQLARWRLQKRLQVLASTRQILCKMAFCHAMEDVP